jgi:hypothetical protein
MTDHIDHRYTSVQFSLTEDKVVTNETVKVSVTVQAMIDGETITNGNLSSSIRSILDQFIKADWAFSNPMRQFDTGIEKATFSAHCRIPASENYDLTARATALNAKGIGLYNVVTDTSIPAKQIKEAESELRASLLKLIQQEADVMSSDGYTYTIGQVSFSSVGQTMAKSMRASTYATASFNDADDDAIGNSERIALTANVVLTAANFPLRNQDYV